MKLYLIRHGATPATEKKLYCGSTDVPLSEAGRAALKGVGYPEAKHYFTSGMKRTDETMEILYPGIPYQRRPGLREMDFGEFEGKSYEELKGLGIYQEWLNEDNEANPCPGGESGKQALKRALRVLEELVENGGDSVVVSHGGIIAGVMGRWFAKEGRTRYEWQPGPGAGYEVRLENGRAAGYGRLVSGEKRGRAFFTVDF